MKYVYGRGEKDGKKKDTNKLKRQTTLGIPIDFIPEILYIYEYAYKIQI